MIVSKNFLSHFFSDIHNFSEEKIYDAFLRSGIEVESVEKIISPSGLCYGFIQDCQKMENTNNLSMCKVHIPRTNEVLNIICGAKNARTGLKVVVAKIGAKIFNQKIEISKRKMAGTFSEGMICGYSELFDSLLLTKSRESQKGIIELDDNWNCEEEFKNSDLGLDDVIYSITLPTNRKDLCSVWGLSMELQKNLANSSQISIPKLNEEDFFSWKIKQLLLLNNFSAINPSSFLSIYCWAAFREIPEINKDTLQNAFEVQKTEKIILDNNELTKTNQTDYFFNHLLRDFLQQIYSLQFKVDDINSQNEPTTICLDEKKIQFFFNQSVDFGKKILEKLNKIDFKCSIDNGILKIIPPKWRSDLKDFDSFLNELVIHFPLDEIKEHEKKITITSIKDVNLDINVLLKISNFLKSNGFLETSSFNLQPLEQVKKTDIFNDLSTFTISNPSSTSDTLRHHALCELIEIVKYNYRQKNELFPIFELVQVDEEGHSYWTLNIVSPITEKSFPLNSTKLTFDFFDIKSLIKKLNFLIKDNWEWKACEVDIPLFQTNQTQQIYSQNKSIGYLGKIADDEIFMVGLVAKIIPQDQNKKNITFKEPVTFPTSSKDISIEIFADNTGVNLLEIILFIESVPFCVKCKLVEKYKTDKSTSYLFNCIFQSDTDTLTKEQLNSSLEKIKNFLNEKNIKIK